MAAMRLHAAGKFAEALAEYEALLTEKGQSPEADYRLRTLLFKLYRHTGDIDHAVAMLEPLAEKNPGDAPLVKDFLEICMEHKRPQPVLRFARQMLRSYPNDVHLHELMATSYEQLGQYADMLPHMAPLLKADANRDEGFFIRYVRQLHRAGELALAERIVEKGLARHPQSQGLLELNALSQGLARQFTQAADTYRLIAAHYPDNRQAIALAGAMALLTTDFKEGFEEYAARPHISEMEKRFIDYCPKWQGEALRGKKLLLWCEQGIGDVLMFSGFTPWLQQQGADVTMVVAGKLMPLLARSFLEAKVIVDAHVSKEGVFDYHLPMGELIRYVLPHYIPAEHPPYLKPDAVRTAELRRRYAALAEAHGKKRLIGISWHTANPEVGFVRNVALEQWAPLFLLPDVQFISLQYDDHAAEIDAVNRRFPQALFCDPDIDAFKDVDALAAQIAALDHVITIDNFIAHLSGALGAPTTVLMPAMPDWRWGIEGATCRWYKSVTLERQEKSLEWKAVMQCVAAGLR